MGVTRFLREGRYGREGGGEAAGSVPGALQRREGAREEEEEGEGRSDREKHFLGQPAPSEHPAAPSAVHLE